MSDSTEKRAAAPYVSYTSLKNFVTSLRASGGVPIVIDNSVFGGMSGGSRSQMKSALRFLNLIDGDSKPTARMHEAVDASGDDAQWKAFVGRMLKEYYAPILAHPLTSTTPSALKKEFELVFSGNPDVIGKAITFFIHAAKEAGLPLSPRLTERQKGAGGGKRQPRRRAADLGGAASTDNQLDPGALSKANGASEAPKPRKVHEHQMALVEIINTYTDMDDQMRSALLGVVGFIATKGVST